MPDSTQIAATAAAAPGWVTYASILLSALALAVAIWAARSAAREAREANAIQSRLLSLESQRERDRRQSSVRARVTVQLTEGMRRMPQIVVTNHGPATIRNVRLWLDGEPFETCDDILRPKEPIDVLAPESEFGFDLFRSSMTPNRQRVVKAAWVVPDGTEDTVETTVRP